MYGNRDNPLVVLVRHAIVWALLALAGCATPPHPLRVAPISSDEVCALSPEAVVQLLHQAGYTNEQILKLGTDIRNGLALYGAAQIIEGDKIATVFVANREFIYMCCRDQRAYMYDAEERTFLPAPRRQVAAGRRDAMMAQ